jgi:hypothetical protein
MKTRGEYEIDETDEKASGFRLFRFLSRSFQIEPAAPQTFSIVKREIIANIRNFKILVAFATMTLMLLVSAHLLALDYRHRLNNWTVNQISQRDPFVGGGVKYELPDGSFSYRIGIGHSPPIQRP